MQANLEDQILYMLSTATGSLLDNIALINTLDQSKTTWEEVNQMLVVAEDTAAKIEQASAQYRPCSVRASILFFVLNDLSRVDGMYQFSLDAYTDLFQISIRNSAKSDNLQERIRTLNDYHTHAVYRYTSRGLFERHKLLLSLQMCTKILSAANSLNAPEFQFFMKGGTVLDRSAQPTNPDATWIAEAAWDNITELETQVPAFRGIVASIESGLQEWETWYRNPAPESAELPGEWESKCTDLQRMLLVRCLRPDRIIFSCTSFVANNLGRKYIEQPVLDLKEVYGDSSPVSPLIFVLSPGVDPTDMLKKLGVDRGMADRIFSVALGQVRCLACDQYPWVHKNVSWVLMHVISPECALGNCG
jgi:dynein heavy chain